MIQHVSSILIVTLVVIGLLTIAISIESSIHNRRMRKKLSSVKMKPPQRWDTYKKIPLGKYKRKV